MDRAWRRRGSSVRAITLLVTGGAIMIVGAELMVHGVRAPTDLFVVNSIVLKTDASGTRGQGGRMRVIERWEHLDGRPGRIPG
jgi:hypothetical protein